MRKSAIFAAGIVLLAALSSTPPRTEAEHEDFFTKAPWQAGASRGISTSFGEFFHLGLDYYALDFLTPTSDSIRAAQDGTVVFVNPSGTCDPAGSYGRQVVVRSTSTSPDDPMFWTRFAHLSGTAVEPGYDVFQGDDLGNPGDTGNTWSKYPEIPCGVHLHFAIYHDLDQELDCTLPQPQDCSQHPGSIEGQTDFETEESLDSTNEKIGDETIHPQAGLAMRQEYYLDGRWASVGWVHDLDPGQPPGLEMHRTPPNNGWEQIFQKHPDASGNEVGGIYVRDAAPTVSAWVKPDFWAVWQAEGGASSTLGLPLASELGACPAYAPRGCLRLQEFECGYIWSNGQDIEPVTCGRGLLVFTNSPAYFRSKFTQGVWVQTGDGPSAGPGPNSLKYFGNGLVFHITDEAGNGNLRKSLDYGATWQTVAPPAGADNILDIDQAPSGRLWGLWVDKPGSPYHIKVYYSDDQGSTWTYGNITVSNRRGYYIAVHPNGNYIAFSRRGGNSFSGVWLNYSTDGGATWSSGRQVTGGILQGQQADGGLVWTNSGNIVTYLTMGAGAKLYLCIIPIPQGSTCGSPKIDKQGASYWGQVVRGDNGVLFAVKNPAGSPDSDRRSVFRSTDNGVSWDEFLAPAPVNELRGAAYDALTDTLYVAGPDGVNVYRWRQASNPELPVAWEEMPNPPGLIRGKNMALIDELDAPP